MIEYKIIDDEDLIEKFGPNWARFPIDFNFNHIDFKLATMRVNGVVYTECSNEYINAFKKAKMWDKLKHD